MDIAQNISLREELPDKWRDWVDKLGGERELGKVEYVSWYDDTELVLGFHGGIVKLRVRARDNK